ncbi:MAG: para-aminobenzoate synthetase/4-amino-4-deoxychorismate lyase [Candidatus Latescibacterota bacterium]
MYEYKTAHLDSFSRNKDERSFVFSGLQEEWTTHELSDVLPLLAQIEAAVSQGLHAVGYMSYEAAGGLHASLATGEAGPLPLLHFASYAERHAVRAGEGLSEGDYSVGDWRPSITRAEYDEAIEAIRDYLAAGDTYQTNFTFRLRAGFSGDPAALYGALCRAQAAPYGAYLDCGRYVVLSASPELFWRLANGVLTTRPMKGTSRRGRWAAEDQALAAELVASLKERAENVMVTDMLRNDLGRISEVGSVVVPALFRTECYPTLWQLTSTVQSRLAAGVGLADIFAALFPCASVTGAPKVRTMEIIRQLEQGPRGVYTGCIGYISPGLEACFNVAIRTAVLDREKGELEFGVGGGITWDSSAEAEYRECLVKARVLKERRPVFQLLETLLWDGDGYFLLERHLRRLYSSAQYWGFSCDLEDVRNLLNEYSKPFEQKEMRVRLLVDESGVIEVQTTPFLPAQDGPMPVRLAAESIDRADPFLYHKTTHRTVYEEARAVAPPEGDVLLYNARGELTEFCIGNLAVETAEGMFTTPQESGLLAGTFRAELLERGEIQEKTLKKEDLADAKAVYLINSLRRFVLVEFV